LPKPEPEPARTTKDASSVLGILQMAKDNAARQRAGGARAGGGAAGLPGQAAEGVSSTSDAPASAPVVQGPAQLLADLKKRIQSASSVSSDKRRAIEKDVMTLLPKLDTMKIADLVARLCEVEALRTGAFLNELTAALVGNIPRFRSTDLTKLTAACAEWALVTGSGSSDDTKSRLGEELRNFFNSVSNEVLLRLMDIAPGDLARIGAALASVGVGGVRLFASLARAGVARGDRFSPSELVALIGAFDKARYYSTTLFEALVKCLKMNMKEVDPKGLVAGMRYLATCQIRDEDLGQVIGDHLSKKPILSAEDYCSLAWTFCALDLHHDKLFRTVFRALEDANVSASETLCQLYEIHLTLQAFHHSSYKDYELEDETVQSLREHFKKHRGKEKVKLERSSERIHADVADQLQEVVDASISMGHTTSLGFSVDIAVERRKNSKSGPLMCLDIDGASNLMRSLDPQENVGFGQAVRVRGGMALKRRLLMKNGIKMGVLTEDEWKGLDGDRQKEDQLRRMLKKAGVSEDRLL